MSLRIYPVENSVDPDKVASQKPADQDAHGFSSCL